jgi:hypothetical protein
MHLLLIFSAVFEPTVFHPLIAFFPLLTLKSETLSGLGLHFLAFSELVPTARQTFYSVELIEGVLSFHLGL